VHRLTDNVYKLGVWCQTNDTYDIRYYSTHAELEKAQVTWGTKLPHVRPDSVFVGAIGTSWSKGAWQKVIDMVEYTNKQGVCCWFVEIPDIKATIPYECIGGMRDIACAWAQDLGFEWFLMIENDALPEPDLIMRLLKPQLPIVVPYIVDSNNKQSIAAPHYEANTGVKIVNWSALTCVLIWTKVLNCFDSGKPFHGTLHESDFFNKLMHFGHKAYQDTDTELKIAKNPTYHGCMKSLHELWRFWEDAFDRNSKPPDRKPIDPKDEREVYTI